MYLKRLYELSTTFEIPQYGFDEDLVTKIIRLSEDGTYIMTISPSGDKKGRREGKRCVVPRETPQRTSGIQPRLLADNPEYVLGIEINKDADEKPSSSNPKVSERHQAFRKLVDDCAEETGNSAVKSVSRWLNTNGPSKIPENVISSFTDDDLIVFEVKSAEGWTNPLDCPEVKDFWPKYLDKQHNSAEAMCVITGQVGKISDRFPVPIKGVPGGQTTGCSLVSVNFSAGNSYGLTEALNSPIKLKVADAICKTVNRLLSDPNHHLSISNAMAAIFWTSELHRNISFVTLLEDPSPEEVKKLLESPFHGDKDALSLEEDRFYLLLLSANGGRIVIRDFIETTLSKVFASLQLWFRDVVVHKLDSQCSLVYPRLRDLASCLYRDAKDVAPAIPEKLFRVALDGSQFPSMLLSLGVKRNLAEQSPNKRAGQEDYSRIALLKAIIARKEGRDMSTLVKDHPNPAYHCGRLLAILERLQKAALGLTNATIVDRFYGAASTSPASVFGTLLSKAQAHLSKLRKENRERFFQQDIEEVLGSIGECFPATLSQHDQALFALGYYHQRLYDRQQALQHRTTSEQNHSEEE